MRVLQIVVVVLASLGVLFALRISWAFLMAMGGVWGVAVAGITGAAVVGGLAWLFRP